MSIQQIIGIMWNTWSSSSSLSPIRKNRLIITWFILAFVCLLRHTISDSINLKLCSECTAIYILNTNKIVSSQCLLMIADSSSSTNISIINLATDSTPNDKSLKRIQIFNYESSQQSLTLTTNCLNMSLLLVQSTIRFPDFTQAILLIRSNINNYILPFNLISEKSKKIIVEQSSVKNVPVNYTYEPFLDTYWNQHNKDILLLGWLPYFSRCEFKTSGRIMISDILNPWINNDYELDKVGYICNSTDSWFWGQSLQCQNKKTVTKCVLQEAYVSKPKKQFWWKNKEHPIFYFIQPSKISSSLLQLDTKERLSAMTEQYYNDLIALSYQTYFNLQEQIPNRFTLHFQIASIQGLSEMQILKAELKGYKISNPEEYGIMDGQARLEIQVQYLSNFDTLIAYGKQPWAYVLIFSGLMLGLIAIFKIILCLGNFNLFLSTIFKLIMFPISKGFLMAFILCTSFLGIFFALAANTNYKAIAVNFDNSSSGTDFQSYTGRVGLSIFFVGYFLLSLGISQSFKVLTTDQTKSMLEDELIQKQLSDCNKQWEAETIEQQSNFIIKNMNSHRKYLVTYMLGYTFVLLLLYYAQLTFSFPQKLIFIIFGYPFIHKVTIAIYRHVVVKELLYLSAILITLQVFLDIMIVSDMLIWETIIFYFTKLITQNVICIAIQLLGQWTAQKLNNYLTTTQQSKIPLSKPQLLLLTLKPTIQSISSESRYEKTFFYCNLLSTRFAAILTRPFLIMLILLTIKYNYICQDLQENQNDLIKIFLMLICFFPIDVLVITIGVNVFQGKFGLEIFKCLEFNRFKFNKRKGRWINDLFHQGRSIQHFYREFQKFCFSSQMYLLIFIISFSLLTILIGFKIILEVNYVSFIDPALLVILIVVWFTGNLASIIISFLTIKFKIYQRKQDGKMRARLQNVQKILKKSNFSQYLQTQAVKTYFLYHCKQWIITNLTKIFDKQDFTEKNYQFLIKYKHYKSLLKKKKIEQRKMLEGDNESKQQQIESEQYKDKKLVIRLPKKDFQQFAQPLISSWLYIAKQFVFLKALVAKLRDTRKRESCEFCSMSIQLQVIQKKQFAALVNQYRVLNVGRRFSQEHFVQFYKYNQEYITLCIECKDRKLYIEKKNLDVNGSPRKILQKWLIMARSNILHRKKPNTKPIQ